MAKIERLAAKRIALQSICCDGRPFLKACIVVQNLELTCDEAGKPFAGQLTELGGAFSRHLRLPPHPYA